MHCYSPECNRLRIQHFPPDQP